MNWQRKKLGEICEENIKSPFKVENATNTGEYPFFTSGDNILTHEEYLVDGENIFLATGGYANVKYFKGKASYSADTWSLKVKNASTKYVFYQIFEKLKYIDEVLFRGSGLRHLQKKEFLNFEIPVPPLPVQQKIVKILDTIQSAVEVQEKIIEKTKELKKALMNLLFHYGLSGLRIKELAGLRVDELTSSEIKKFGLKLKKTEIGEIPEHWEVVRLGEVAVEIIYGISKKAGKYGKYPILGMNNLQDGKINYQEVRYVDLDSGTFEKFKVEKGDILFNRTNSLELVGKTALFNLEGDFVFASYLLRIKALLSKLWPHYLNYYLNFESTQQALKTIAYRGASQVNISASRLANFRLPLPPLSEQREIAEILQMIDQKIEIEKKKKELYYELFKTLLNKIMNQEIDI